MSDYREVGTIREHLKETILKDVLYLQYLNQISFREDVSDAERDSIDKIHKDNDYHYYNSMILYSPISLKIDMVFLPRMLFLL